MDDNAKQKSLLLLIISVGFGFAVFHLVSSHFQSFRPTDAALSKNTLSGLATYKDVLVSSMRGEAYAEFEPAISRFRSEKKQVVLWFGASQLHAVNQFKEGDERAVYYANNRADNRGSKFGYLQVSYPNGNFNEFLGTYLIFRHYNQLPDWIIVSLTFDDLREPGVRQRVLRNLPSIASLDLPITSPGFENIEKARETDKTSATTNTLTATTGTPQEILEKTLSDRLSDRWEAFANRGNLSSIISVKTKIYAGLIFGWLMEPFLGEINPVPPVPNDIKDWNGKGLDGLIRLAQDDGTKVLLYRAPHPTYEGDFYHDRKRYDDYFSVIQKEYANGSDVFYVDLEPVVPIEFWGLNNTGRLDVFHFQSEGHRLLGEAVDAFFEGQERTH